MMDRNTLLDLIPAYALGALDADERAEVEALLAADAEAQHLLADYQAVTEAMVLATPARRAPAHLGGDLKQRLAAARPAPPKPVSSAPIEVLPHGRRSPLLIPLVAVAAIMIVLLGLLLILRNQQDPSQVYAQIAALPDALHYPITPVFQPTTSGEMVVSPDGKLAVVRVEDLPDINPDQTFQLWLIDANGARSGGLLKFASPQGPNYISLPLDKPVQEYKSFGVSIEPEGGSPKADGPSGPRAFGVSIAT
jgi:anti-sigma-K factor RskA